MRGNPEIASSRGHRTMLGGNIRRGLADWLIVPALRSSSDCFGCGIGEAASTIRRSCAGLFLRAIV